jgi:hypothetical protein
MRLVSPLVMEKEKEGDLRESSDKVEPVIVVADQEGFEFAEKISE